MNTTRQRKLPFDELYASAKEQRRAERLARILSHDKRITTAARLFDMAEATAIAKGEHHGQ